MTAPGRAPVPASIRVRRLSVRHEGAESSVEAVRDVELAVEPGELVSLIGPSGCGKSTLLGAIGGFVRPSSGDVCVDGRPVGAPEPERGIVFQQHSLFPWLSVVDNVAFGLKMRGVAAKERRRQAESMLELVGLAGFGRRYPSELSGGMQHRAELARVLVNGPRVLLLDEPFGALDVQTRATMQDLLLEIWLRLRTTIVLVTHDIDEAILLSDRILVMTRRPGEIGWERRIDFARPRQLGVMATPEFVAIKRECMDRIRREGDVRRAD